MRKLKNKKSVAETLWKKWNFMKPAHFYKNFFFKKDTEGVAQSLKISLKFFWLFRFFSILSSTKATYPMYMSFTEFPLIY